MLIFRRNICIILIRYIFYKQNWKCIVLSAFNLLWAFLLNREFNPLAGIIRTDVFVPCHLFVFCFLFCLVVSVFYTLCSLKYIFSLFILYSFCEMNISCFYSSWYLHVDFPEMFLTNDSIIQAKQNAFSCAPIWDENYRSHRPHQPHPASTLWALSKSFWTYNPELCILWHLYSQLA